MEMSKLKDQDTEDGTLNHFIKAVFKINASVWIDIAIAVYIAEHQTSAPLKI